MASISGGDSGMLGHDRCIGSFGHRKDGAKILESGHLRTSTGER